VTKFKTTLVFGTGFIAGISAVVGTVIFLSYCIGEVPPQTHTR
jgi:hypothetical protein